MRGNTCAGDVNVGTSEGAGVRCGGHAARQRGRGPGRGHERRREGTGNVNREDRVREDAAAHDDEWLRLALAMSASMDEVPAPAMMTSGDYGWVPVETRTTNAQNTVTAGTTAEAAAAGARACDHGEDVGLNESEAAVVNDVTASTNAAEYRLPLSEVSVNPPFPNEPATTKATKTSSSRAEPTPPPPPPSPPSREDEWRRDEGDGDVENERGREKQQLRWRDKQSRECSPAKLAASAGARANFGILSTPAAAADGVGLTPRARRRAAAPLWAAAGHGGKDFPLPSGVLSTYCHGATRS